MSTLPSDWVDLLFGKLALSYGSAWLLQWEGFNMAEVKAEWAKELGGFKDTPSRITVGLQNLPDKPPSAAHFRRLCSTASPSGEAYEPPKLPAAGIVSDPEVARAGLAQLAAIKARLDSGGPVKPIGDGVDPKDWAWKLRDQELNHGSDGMTSASQQAWRDALAPELRAMRSQQERQA
jgi:hypothetical protein